MFQKFITYIKLSRINAYRKEASDWGLIFIYGLK